MEERGYEPKNRGSHKKVEKARKWTLPWSFQKRGEAWISHEKFRYGESRNCGQSLAHVGHSKTC